MKRHVMVHTVIAGVLFSGLGVSLAWGQGGDPARRPLYPLGFGPGTRVTLLEESPDGAPGLAVGVSGTVICGDAVDCTRSILVMWDLYSRGQDDETGCVSATAGLYPPGATMWVDPAKVKLGHAFD